MVGVIEKEIQTVRDRRWGSRWRRGEEYILQGDVEMLTEGRQGLTFLVL